MASKNKNELLAYFQNEAFFNLPVDASFTSLTIKNTQCSDQFKLFIQTKKNHINQITFQGSGCIFSRANLAMVCELLLAKS